MQGHIHLLRGDGGQIRTGHDGSQGAGRFYEVDPGAHEHFKRVLGIAHGGMMWSEAILNTAKEQKNKKRGRRYSELLTHDVCRRLQAHMEKHGEDLEWIAQEANNGLMDIPAQTLKMYFKKFRLAAREKEPAQAEPIVEIAEEMPPTSEKEPEEPRPAALDDHWEEIEKELVEEAKPAGAVAVVNGEARSALKELPAALAQLQQLGLAVEVDISIRVHGTLGGEA